eukprot:COSAG06_NODE_4441_length_4263_cov_1.817003_3_plen_101_part_00
MLASSRPSGPRRDNPEARAARRWPAVMTPKRAARRAGDAAASHTAADGAGPSIEGARTYAHATSRGAVAGFNAFRAALRKTPEKLGRDLAHSLLSLLYRL